MSYCRWSTDLPNNKQSDLYVYADVMGGYTIHVASRRRICNTPIPQYNEGDDFTEWYYKKRDWIKENNQFEDINGPFDGESWYGLSVEEVVEVLKILENAGYNFPENLADVIVEDDQLD